MGKMDIQQIKDKISNCLSILSSSKCTDMFYVIFVICEYFKYSAALQHVSNCANTRALRDIFEFGEIIAEYRNSFAHSESMKYLSETIDKLREYSNEICSAFSGDIYFKVYDALN